MSKLKNMYREWFGLREATAADQAKLNQELEKTAELTKQIQDNMAGLTETELEEAQLINNITDYQGHVIYRLRDPQEAKMVAKDIMQWTAKKGFTIIKHERSASGKTGYFYFRLGQDPGTESQKIQGYFSQMPEIQSFIFKAPGTQKTV